MRDKKIRSVCQKFLAVEIFSVRNFYNSVLIFINIYLFVKFLSFLYRTLLEWQTKISIFLIFFSFKNWKIQIMQHFNTKSSKKLKIPYITFCFQINFENQKNQNLVYYQNQNSKLWKHVFFSRVLRLW